MPKAGSIFTYSGVDTSALRWGLGRGGGCHFQHKSAAGDGRDMEGEVKRQPACANGTVLKVGTRAYIPDHDTDYFTVASSGSVGSKDPLAGVLGAARWHGGSTAITNVPLTNAADDPITVGQLGGAAPSTRYSRLRSCRTGPGASPAGTTRWARTLAARRRTSRRTPPRTCFPPSARTTRPALHNQARPARRRRADFSKPRHQHVAVCGRQHGRVPGHHEHQLGGGRFDSSTGSYADGLVSHDGSNITTSHTGFWHSKQPGTPSPG